MTKVRKLDNLAGDWSKWLQQAKMSETMKERMNNHVNNNADGMNALFKVVTGLMKVKNDIINQLDNADTDVQAYTDGQRGGEGYVIGQGDSKLVNRSGFSAANMSKER
jgi:predicted DNA binding protein